MPSRRSRPVALVRAEHDAPPARLTSSERELLDEALRRGEDLREELESKVAAYGRWLLAEIFDNDASTVIDERATNPVWLELVRRAGGPSLRISRRILYVAVNIAARDKRIQDQAWRGLDAGRKELLLPLGEDARLREAAQHVAKFNLTQPKTRAYVTELLRTQGRPRQVRISAPRLVAQVKKLRTGLERPGLRRKLGELRSDLAPEEREGVLAEIGKLRDVLEELARAIRGRK